MKIGFIGAGKVGSAFGRYLYEKGFKITGYFSRTEDSARKAAEFTKSSVLSIQELAEESSYIFITTPDGAISEVWENLKKFNIKGKKIFHMSGCLSSDVFNGSRDLGVDSYSLHPLYPFTDKNCYDKLNKVIFSLEGENIENIKEFLDRAELKYFLLNKQDKVKYHAAAVFASNYLVAISKIAKDLLFECEIKEDFIIDAIYPLMEGALLNIKEKGIEDALTGPIVRGDYKTISMHLENLREYKDIYKKLGLVALGIEREKSCDDEKAKKLDEIEFLLRSEGI